MRGVGKDNEPEGSKRIAKLHGEELVSNNQDIEQIKAIVETTGERYVSKGGTIQFAGIENGSTVRIIPAGFCWR